MKELESFLDKIEKVMESNDQYKFEAYSFVMAALHHTVSKLPKARHITGKELLEGIRDYALEQFGPLARTVLEYWGIHQTEDFGHIVFHLIDAHLLKKTEEDSLQDFKNAYDFNQAFQYEIKEE